MAAPSVHEINVRFALRIQKLRMKETVELRMNIVTARHIDTHTHTHTHRYIYIYIDTLRISVTRKLIMITEKCKYKICLLQEGKRRCIVYLVTCTENRSLGGNTT